MYFLNMTAWHLQKLQWLHQKLLITGISVEDAKKLYEEGVISGGMIPKVDCCIEAINAGVKDVTIMDGRVPHAILMELLTDEGAGTMIVGNWFKYC